MTKLGNDRVVRKGGRYGRVMGTLWRHEKRDKCGRAAMGLLLDIWSWCADQSAQTVPEKSMRKLFAGDPNARRQLNELLEAGFVDRVEGGYAPHDWADHSGFSKDSAEMEMKTDLRCSRDEDVMSAPREIIRQLHPSRAHASPSSPDHQIPEEKKKERERAPANDFERYEPADEAPLAFPPSQAWTDIQTAGKLVRKLFKPRFEAQGLGMWQEGDKTHQHVMAFARWAVSVPGVSAEAAVSKALDGFFASPRARAGGFKVAWLATGAAEYFSDPVAPPKPPRDVTRGVFKPQPGDFRKWAEGEYENYIDNIFGDAPKAAAE